MNEYMRTLFLISCFSFFFSVVKGQDTLTVEDLKREVLQLKADVNIIQLNLIRGDKKFKRGILVATIGYTITITGGLMLGRKNDDLGKVLLIAGGSTGVIGTVMMLDAFKYLGKAGNNSRRH